MPANLGLLDQRQALLWVQENIACKYVSSLVDKEENSNFFKNLLHKVSLNISVKSRQYSFLVMLTSGVVREDDTILYLVSVSIVDQPRHLNVIHFFGRHFGAIHG